ncbi:MAG: calcium/sodium antiporter [Thermoguttaceae bacterium]|nr:calcium/sodium antiporter [Thermoguttaceae bacterium]MDW8077329.1 calcium/sodium antiporter [Thermoguttaceae bacterium]
MSPAAYLFAALQLIGGLALLYCGGERLVFGAARLAVVLGIPPLVVGLTVVALGTSTPELAVTVQAVISSTADVGLGNVVGSGIFNILVILGIAAWLQPLEVSARLVRYEVPLMIVVAAGLWGLSSRKNLGWLEGATFLIALLFYMSWLVTQARREHTQFRQSLESEVVPQAPGSWAGPFAAVVFCAIGITLLWIGSEWTVSGAVRLARLAGVPELVLGLTLVAAGTSLPELATSLAAAIKRNADICVGNVVGSNILNVVAVLAPACLLAPGGLAVNEQLLRLDFPTLLGASVLCFPVFWSGGRIDRVEGGLFIVVYAGYILALAAEATRSANFLLWTNLFVLGFVPASIAAALLWALTQQFYRRSK